MSARARVQKYRQSGGASDLARVEVLVPHARREEILASAARMRLEHRSSKRRLEALCAEAGEKYSVRIFDNVDLARASDLPERASVVAAALMERGDARAFHLGRRILAELAS